MMVIKTMQEANDSKKFLSGQLADRVIHIIDVLNMTYPGREKNLSGDGGHVVVFEKKKEFEKFILGKPIPEVVEVGNFGAVEVFVLSNNEYGITYLIPEGIVPTAEVLKAFPNF